MIPASTNAPKTRPVTTPDGRQLTDEQFKKWRKSRLNEEVAREANKVETLCRMAKWELELVVGMCLKTFPNTVTRADDPRPRVIECSKPPHILGAIQICEIPPNKLIWAHQDHHCLRGRLQ